MDNNSTYEQYEQEIDLKDLMFAVLHKWRPVILVAAGSWTHWSFGRGQGCDDNTGSRMILEVSKETREKYQEELDHLREE